VSPDGELGNLPFAAMPGLDPSHFLLEEKTVAVVPVPRLLPELLEDNGKTDRAPRFVAIGGIDYAEARAAEPLPVREVPLRAGTPRQWSPLPGSRPEVESLKALFSRTVRGEVELVTGPDASRESFVRAALKATHLHLSTHGFFLPPDKVVSRKYQRTAHLGERQRAPVLHPGVQSGLVFAGANRPTEQSDGVLTALEVAELELGGLQLAVLSACETGLGQGLSGEGLLGLQRAFQVAGTRAVVASLWQVQDEATAALMGLFYHHLLEKKQPPLEALRQAQLTLLRHPEAIPALAKLRRGLDFDEKDIPKVVADTKPTPEGKRATVDQWAAFVLSGWGR
jgi:CHAT domain-containing protein